MLLSVDAKLKLINNKNKLIKYLQKNTEGFRLLNKKWLFDKDIALELLSLGYDLSGIMKRLPDFVKNDETILKTALYRNRLLYNFLPYELKFNKDVFKIFLSAGGTISWIEIDNLRSQKEFQELLNDDIMEYAFNCAKDNWTTRFHFPGNFASDLPLAYKYNKNFIKKIITENGENIVYLTDDLKNDEEIIELSKDSKENKK